MSERYPGALITKTPVTPAGPQQDGAASGVWTLDQQMQYQKQGVWPTQGTVGPDAYIENLFSTYLYTGNGSTQTITNGIDLSGKGGLVWIKSRSDPSQNNVFDTVRGRGQVLHTDNVAGNTGVPAIYDITAFTSTGFTLGIDGYGTNTNGRTYASWSFREQAKFFDIVTYTGTGANRTIAHNLGSTPGCIIVKRTDTTGNWQVYHSGLTSAAYSIQLNLTSAQASATTVWNSTAPTSSVFSVGTDASVNASGGTYVAYLFASNAGGFGAAGTDNVITCGNFTADGSGNATVNLGYEPQWVMFKRTDVSQDWYIFDVMRGMPVSGPAVSLAPNNSSAEVSYSGSMPAPTATGFMIPGTFGASAPVIYIAIRRGPMKTPTDATKVYNAIARTGTGANVTVTGLGFATDLVISEARGGTNNPTWFDRLRGAGQQVMSSVTSAELTYTNTLTGFDSNNGYLLGADGYDGSINYASRNYVNWNFSRAPGFFDEVCYTGTGALLTVNHNLGVVPELVINKSRSTTFGWYVTYNFTSTTYDTIVLNTDAAKNSTAPYGTGAVFYSGQPTATTLPFATNATINTSGQTQVAYLFATCPGVSKVGSYTGTGATQTINCGFTGGARFVLIKRTDSTGDWYVWDTARGMVSGTDPYLLLNSTAAEVNANSVYTATTGFQIVSTAAGINASGGSYIFFAVS